MGLGVQQNGAVRGEAKPSTEEETEERGKERKEKKRFDSVRC